MKPTKLVLIIALAVAAALRPAVQAQSNVYSSNIVGYINVALSPGWNLATAQLITTPSNNANDVLPGAPDGSLLYRFDLGSYKEAATYLTGVGWYPISGDTNDPALNLPLGEGFFIWTPQACTITIVGEVAQGCLANVIPVGYSLKGSMVPQAGLLHDVLLFPNTTGVRACVLFDTPWVCPLFSCYMYTTFWSPADPYINVAQGFVVQSPMPQLWIRNFIVQGPTPARAGTDSALHILSCKIRDGMVTLQISKTTERYNVQFSTNRVDWNTVATDQTGVTWNCALPPGPQGYFQVSQP